MGVVYLAKDSHTGEELVLKLIHPDLVTGEDAVKRLMAEGLTARQIRHPKIVAVYDVSQYDEQPYFTMEFVRGGTLRSWMANNMASGRDVPLDTAVGIMKSMLAGITEAHRMGIVHRDLKPENVLLAGNPDDGNFDLKILDFGIAKAVSSTRSSSGGPIGTPLYMAPEQMTAAETVGPAADIYSLSVMFYELLMEAAPQARWEPVSKSRSDVPKAIDELIEKGLSVRPRSRYASAAEFEKALDAAMRPEPQPPAPPVDPNDKPFVPGPPTPEPPLPPPPLPPAPPPQPPPQPLPNPVRGGIWASLSPKAKLWIYGIAAFTVIGIIGNMMNGGTPPPDTDGDGIVNSADDCPTVAGPITNGGCPATPPPPPVVPDPVKPVKPDPRPPQPPPQPPPISPVTERWRDDSGNVYVVERDGAHFEGSAENVRVLGVNYGHVDMEGFISPTGGTIMMANARGVVYQSPVGAAVPGTDPRTTDALFGTMRFHINH
jgi:hypothetical protein